MDAENSSDSLDLETWITPREAAAMIGVTSHQVRHLARSKVLEARKFGHAWLVSRASVEAYAQIEHHPGPKPEPLSHSG